MDKNVKNSLIMAGSALAGGYGGSWAAQRLCAAVGCNLGAWGPAIGAVLGAMAATSVTKSLIGDPYDFPDFDEAMEAGESAIDEAVNAAKKL
jgi:hypothetical protein